MIDNINVPASVLHEKDGRAYRIAGKILRMDESAGTCDMLFRKGPDAVIKRGIPMSRIAVNEDIIDMIKQARAAESAPADKPLDFVCRKIGRYVCAISDGVKTELSGIVANAFERTRESSAVHVFPSLTQARAAEQSGMYMDAPTDPEAIASMLVDEDADWAAVRTFWERLREEYVGTMDNPAPESLTMAEAIGNVYAKHYSAKALNEDLDAPGDSAPMRISVGKSELKNAIRRILQAQTELNALYPDSSQYKPIDQYRNKRGGGISSTKRIPIGASDVEVPADFHWTDERIFDFDSNRFCANYDVKLDRGRLCFAPNSKWKGERRIDRPSPEPLCVWSCPAIGKSSIARAIAEIYSDAYSNAHAGGAAEDFSLIAVIGDSLTQDDEIMLQPKSNASLAEDSPVSANVPDCVLPLYSIPTDEQDGMDGHPLWSLMDDLYNGRSWIYAGIDDYISIGASPDSSEETAQLPDDASRDMDFDAILSALLNDKSRSVSESANYAPGRALNEVAGGYVKFFGNDSTAPLRKDFPDIWNATRQNWYNAYLISPPNTSPYAPALANIIALGFKEAWGRYRARHNAEEPNKLFKKFWKTYIGSGRKGESNYSLSAHLGTHNNEDNTKTSPLDTDPGPNGEPSEARKFIENAGGTFVVPDAHPVPKPKPEPEEYVEADEPAPAEKEKMEDIEGFFGRTPSDGRIPAAQKPLYAAGIILAVNAERMTGPAKSDMESLLLTQSVGEYVLASKWALVAIANRTDSPGTPADGGYLGREGISQLDYIPSKDEFIECASEHAKDINGNDTSMARLPQDLIDMISFLDDDAWRKCIAHGTQWAKTAG